MTSYKIYNSLAEANAEIPVGKARKVILENTVICLARTQSGLFAVEDTCPHLGESLSKGTTNYLNEIVCPWHSYRFSLTNGTECKYRTRNLKTYIIKTDEDGLYLEM